MIFTTCIPLLPLPCRMTLLPANEFHATSLFNRIVAKPIVTGLSLADPSQLISDSPFSTRTRKIVLPSYEHLNVPPHPDTATYWIIDHMDGPYTTDSPRPIGTT